MGLLPRDFKSLASSQFRHPGGDDESSLKHVLQNGAPRISGVPRPSHVPKNCYYLSHQIRVA